MRNVLIALAILSAVFLAPMTSYADHHEEIGTAVLCVTKNVVWSSAMKGPLEVQGFKAQLGIEPPIIYAPFGWCYDPYAVPTWPVVKYSLEGYRIGIFYR